MTEELLCDVLVIGAGPAGSTVARAAAENGANVIVLERKAQVGLPVQCAGYVPQAIRWHSSLPGKCVVQSVEGLRTFLPDGTAQETTVPGYILDRAALEMHMAEGAVTAGARLFLRATAADFSDAGVEVRTEGRQLLIKAKVIVGADGPRSKVARWMNQPPPRLALALQHQVALQRRLAVAEIYFRPEFRGGYAWLFPAGEVARVGAAFVSGSRDGAASLAQLMREMEEDGKIIASPVSSTAGFVPVGGPSALHQGKMLLVGDAAGQTHPITGAGILNAVIAGEMAARSAAQAALAKDLASLEGYEEEWRYVFGPAMAKAVEKRSRLEEAWNGPPAELSRIIRESWITFDEYYDG